MIIFHAEADIITNKRAVAVIMKKLTKWMISMKYVNANNVSM